MNSTDPRSSGDESAEESVMTCVQAVIKEMLDSVEREGGFVLGEIFRNKMLKYEEMSML